MKNSLKFKDLGVDFFAHIQTQKLENSSLIHVNESLRQDLNFNITDKELLEICSGEKQLAKKILYRLFMLAISLATLFLSLVMGDHA